VSAHDLTLAESLSAIGGEREKYHIVTTYNAFCNRNKSSNTKAINYIQSHTV